MTTRQQISPYPIRMEPDLRRALEEAAKAGNRSLHAEIIARLQASFEASPTVARIAGEYGVTGNVDFHKLSSDDAANIVADRVIEKLASTEGIAASLARALRILEEGSGADPKPIRKEPRTPTVPGVNTSKGGSKSPKG